MKYILFFVLAVSCINTISKAQTVTPVNRQLYLDVHVLPEGHVNFNDVAAAHAKDLAVQKKYGVEFIKYWVNEKKGIVYCLSNAADTNSIRDTHREAHGLMPASVVTVLEGTPAKESANLKYFLDVHQLGAGKVTAAAVAEAHQKDLKTQGKYGVNFVNYWVDEKNGTVVCLSQATDAAKVVATHKEAHGLLPSTVEEVKQGQ